MIYSAAQAADDYEFEGYTHWFMPSMYELIEMYNTIGLGSPQGNIGNFVAGYIGGFPVTDQPDYWSSSSKNSTATAWLVDFNTGIGGEVGKNTFKRVRAIRAF